MQRKNILKLFRNNFIAGAIFIMPLWVTVQLVKALVNLLNRTFGLLPTVLQPKTYFSYAGAEILIAFLFILLVGFLVNNLIGKKLISSAEIILSRIPIIRTIYQGVKNLTTGIVGEKKIFSQVVLLEFPIKGLKFIGFVTGVETLSITKEKQKLLKIFIPTTPNPTSGFFCYAPETAVEKLDISVEAAFKIIMTAGYANLNPK